MRRMFCIYQAASYTPIGYINYIHLTFKCQTVYFSTSTFIKIQKDHKAFCGILYGLLVIRLYFGFLALHITIICFMYFSEKHIQKFRFKYRQISSLIANLFDSAFLNLHSEVFILEM